MVAEMEQIQGSTPWIFTKTYFIIFRIRKQLVKEYIVSPDAGFGSQIISQSRKTQKV